MRRAGVLVGLMLCMASAAGSDWLEASSDHFVIYSDQNEKAVAGFAERLELFHAAMSYLSKVPVSKPSPSNRVTIFVVSNAAKVQELVQADNKYLSGIYIPRAGASVALVPKRNGATGQFDMQPETVLYHEYAHHFMAGLTSRRFPRWFTEGFAEFFAGVRFREDSVGLGTPAEYRMVELAYAKSVPMRNLLDYDGGASIKSKSFDSFYGQSWILFHYLQFDPERSGQLAKYQHLLGTGDTALEAAEGAFGDLDELAQDVERYSNRRKLSYVAIGRKQLPIGPIVVRALPPGEAEMMSTRIRSDVGVDDKEAVIVVADARRIAAKHPNDPAVLSALAEAEFDSNNDDAAIGAAERALALDPKQINALIQKGYALSRKISVDKLPDTAWKDVRSHWVKANKVENDNPIPLVQYYLTYLEQGVEPTKTSIDGLEWAMALAPFDPSIRWQAAQQMIRDERLADAAETLAPLAYSPHPGEFTASALKLLQEVEGRIAAADSVQPAAPTAP